MDKFENVLIYTADRIYCETELNGDSQIGLNSGMMEFKKYIETTDIEIICNCKDSYGNNILHRIIECDFYDFYEYFKNNEKTKDYFLKMTQNLNNFSMTPFDLLKSKPNTLKLMCSDISQNIYYITSLMITNEFYSSQYKKIYDDMEKNNYKSNKNTIENIISYCELLNEKTNKKSLQLKHMISVFKRVKKYHYCSDLMIYKYLTSHYKDVKLYNNLYVYSLIGMVSCAIIYYFM
jgi:hypothetical protein